MTISHIVAGLRKAQENGSSLVKNGEVLNRLEDRSIFNEYDVDEELPSVVSSHIIWLIELADEEDLVKEGLVKEEDLVKEGLVKEEDLVKEGLVKEDNMFELKVCLSFAWNALEEEKTMFPGKVESFLSKYHEKFDIRNFNGYSKKMIWDRFNKYLTTGYLER